MTTKAGSLPTEIRQNIDEETLEKLESGELEVKRKEVEVDTKQMTVEEDDGTYYLTVPVSGLADDRDGDDFSNDGLQRTVEQLASEKVPFYFDHGLSKETGRVEYSVLDMRGKWVDGFQKEDQTFGKVRLRNDEYVIDEIEEFVSLHKQEMPVGYSVGFIPKEFDEKQNGGMTVHDHDLLEVSGVGIPSQPDSVTASAGMAIAKGLQDSGIDLEEKGFDEEKIVEGVKNAMSQKQEKQTETKASKEKGENQEIKNELDVEAKQVSPEEVDNVMEIINVHNEAMKEDIRTYMEENDLIEEDEGKEDEETDEMDEEETDGDYGEDEEDGMEQDSSDHTEDSKNTSNQETESSESADTQSENKENGEEFEKTADKNKSSNNKINQLDENLEEKTADNVQTESNDPFVITENSKA